MNQNKVDIIVLAKDQASKTLQGIGKSASTMGKAFTIAAAAASAALTAIGIASFKLAKDASKGMDLARGFARSFGEDTEASLNKLRKASKGTIADIDLMGASNRAALLGVTTSIDELAGLMQTARIRGKEMGLSTTQAFDDIVTGIGRGSPLILDNLGIKIPDALKSTMENMGEAEKTAALLNFAIKDGEQIMSEYGGSVDFASEPFERLTANAANLKQKIGEALNPVVAKAIEIGEALFRLYKEKLTPHLGVLKEAWDELVLSFNEMLQANQLNTQALKDYVEQAVDVAVRALLILLRVGTAVTNWMKENPEIVGTFTAVFFAFGRVMLWVNGQILNTIENLGKLIGMASRAKSEVTDLTNSNVAGGLFGGLVPFANGGIVTEPTPALIGEAGPEAVIPLKDININQTFNNNEIDTDRLATNLAFQLNTLS